MPVLLLILLLAVLGYLWYMRHTTTLTRACRWRQEAPGQWHCVACNARTASETAPKHCARPDT